jgi:hypothetical protein
MWHGIAAKHRPSASISELPSERSKLFAGVIRGLLTDGAVLAAATSALDAMYAAAFDSGAAGAYLTHGVALSGPKITS